MQDLGVAVGLSTTLLTIGVSTACTRAGARCLGEAHDAPSLLKICQATSPDVVITDAATLKPQGVVLVDALGQLPTRVLLVGDGSVLDEVASLIRAGAAGYLPETIDVPALSAAIRDAAAGELVVGAALTRRLLEAHQRDYPPAVLTPREQQILTRIAVGLSTREIAAELFLSQTTVKTHLLRAADKLGTRGRAATVAAALQHNLLSDIAEHGRAGTVP
jgi:DNA-binding NarL/FixJ family response regulator